MEHKIGLGTVQLGLDYGVANRSGRPTDDVVAAILATAWLGGITTLDTAPAYGDSEQRIAAHRPEHAEFAVVSKVPAGCSGAGLRRALEASLAQLQVPALAGLLLHDPADLQGPGADERLEALVAARRDGLTARIGVSVYEPDQARRALETGVLDLVQLPLSLLDQRLLRDGTLASLRGAGYEIHVRSVFLQGALLMRVDELPVPLRPLAPALEAVAAQAAQDSLTLVEAAVGFVQALEDVDLLVVGVDGVAQLDAILAAARRTATMDLQPERYAALGLQDPALVNPSNWTQS